MKLRQLFPVLAIALFGETAVVSFQIKAAQQTDLSEDLCIHALHDSVVVQLCDGNQIWQEWKSDNQSRIRAVSDNSKCKFEDRMQHE